jgi:hypothetical protein
MNNQSRFKEFFFGKVVNVKEKLKLLPKDGPIRAALTDKRLYNILEKISKMADEEFKLVTWNPLFMFIDSHSNEEIQEFESDIRLILNNSRNINVIHFLKEEDDRKWAGGSFEFFIKAVLLK